MEWALLSAVSETDDPFLEMDPLAMEAAPTVDAAAEGVD
jgi:hypothetical protein